MPEEEKGWWGLSWILSTILLTAGVVVAALAVVFAFLGAFAGGGDADAQGYQSAGTPLALGALALVAAGGVLRYGACCDWCDRDDEDGRKKSKTSKSER